VESSLQRCAIDPLLRVAPCASGISQARPAVAKVADAARLERFDALCGSLRNDLFRFALWLARDRSLAEDVVQEALLRAWSNLDSLVDDRAARTWLLTIVRRELARTYKRKRLPTVDIAELVAFNDPALATPEERDLTDVRQAIMELDEDYREPLALQVLLGLSTLEIAAQLQINQATVLTRLFRAREKLRVRLCASDDC
jgi:RNA polymerase sigma-70 factor (ECF subfamily)